MVKVLTIGAGLRNKPTDGMIRLGCMKLIDRIFGINIQLHSDLGDFIPNEKEDFWPNEKFDYIVQTGSPFLWDGMEFSIKWRNLKLALETHPEAKMIFMGIGSCFYQGTDRIPLSEDVLKVLSKSVVIVRDHLAQRLLNLYDIEHEYLPCPAFVHNFMPSSEQTSAVVWYDPSKGISAGDWQDPSKLAEWMDKYVTFIEDHDPSHIYYITDEEKEGATTLKKKFPWMNLMQLRGAHHTVDICRKHHKLLSGRVHIAIPAYASGVDVTLLPVDSRADSFYDFKDEPIIALEDKYEEAIWQRLEKLTKKD